MEDTTESPQGHGLFSSFPFRLSCRGRIVAAFSEASALGTDFARTGKSDGSSFPASQPGQTIMTLRRGLVTDPSFLWWMQQSGAPQEPLSNQPPAPRDLALTVVDETGQTVATHPLPESTVCGLSVCAAPVDSQGIAALAVLHLTCRHPNQSPPCD